MSPGFEGIPTVTGPMGRNVDDLVFMMKVSTLSLFMFLGSLQIILSEDLCKYDSLMKPGIWNDSVFAEYSSKKLKFGYYFDDGVTIASPPVKRAILQTVSALQSQGHELIPITPPNIIEAVRCFIALTSDEGSALNQPQKCSNNVDI